MKVPLLQYLERCLRRMRDARNGRLREVEMIEAARLLGQWDMLVVRRCGDHVIALDPSDRVIADSVLRSGQWQRADTERAIAILRRNGLLRQEALFVDVGANIGTQTVYAMLSGAFAGAVAFEPAPALGEICRMNMALNGLADRVDCHGVAAGARAERLYLDLDPVNMGDNRLSDRPGTRAVAVPVEPLDLFLEAQDIAAGDLGLVWIDVQGHEPEVIEGMPRILEAGVPLVIEFNAADYGVEGVDRFASGLSSHYDGFFAIGDDEPVLQPFERLGEVEQFIDILVVRMA